MNTLKEVERRETRDDGNTYTLEIYASLWTAYRIKGLSKTPLCAPSSYDFAYERFVAGKRTDEK